MVSGRTSIIALVTLIVGFGAGFAIRPVVLPSSATELPVTPLPVSSPASEARGTQYFEAHLDEAKLVIKGCGDGTVRGDECANAERAVVVAQARENRSRFLGH